MERLRWVRPLWLLPVLACTCAPPAKSHRTWQVSVASRPATAPAAPADSDSPSIVLRGALAPSTSPQEYVIEFKYLRTVELDQRSQELERLSLRITGRLTPVADPATKDPSLRLSLRQLNVIVESTNPQGQTTHLDFDSDNRGEPSPIDPLLAPLVSASLRLQVTSTGQLRNVRGVSSLVRERRLGLPPALDTLQTLLNDAAMESLLGQALFPDLPAGPMRAQDQWQLRVPGLPLDPCPAGAMLIGRMIRTSEDSHGFPIITLRAAGQIRQEDGSSRLRITGGEHRLTQSISWNDRSLHQTVDRTLEVIAATQSQPAAREVRTMTLVSSRQNLPDSPPGIPPPRPR